MEIDTPSSGMDFDSRSAEESAETPRSVSRPSKGRLKRGVYAGYLFFLQSKGKLVPEQENYVLKLQGQLKLAELQSAMQLFEKLQSSARSQARAKEDLQQVLHNCPRITAKLILPEPRRIGVGYRDKGALRPLHKNQKVSPRMWWSEDLQPALLQVPEEPRWISSEELFGPEKYDTIQELSLRAVLSQTTQYLQFFERDH